MTVTRELLRFKWVYDEGVVTLIDKKKGISLDLPIAYLDSFLRAGITFKNAHRNEQVLKRQATINSLRSTVKSVRAKPKQKKLL